MKRILSAALGVAYLGITACSEHEPAGPSHPGPGEPPSHWFATTSLTVDESAGAVWVTVHRNEVSVAEQETVRTIPVGASPSDFAVGQGEAFFSAGDSTANVMFAPVQDLLPESPEVFWLSVGTTSTEPSEQDPRFLRVEIRDLVPSLSEAPIDLGLASGRRWPVRVTGVLRGEESTRDIWGEMFTYRLGEPTSLDGESYFPFECEGDFLALHLSLRQDGSIVRAITDVDTTRSGQPEYRLLWHRLFASEPWTLFDLSDPPGAVRRPFDFDTTYAYLGDSSTVRCHVSSVVDGRFIVAGPAGVFPGAVSLTIRFSQSVERRAFPWRYDEGWTFTMTMADNVGLVRVASSSGFSSFNPANGGANSGSEAFSGNLVRSDGIESAPRTPPASSPTRP